MSAPRVSVFIPAWNRERWVVPAVESVLAQSFADFECIVLDDGSTDGTVAAVTAIDDPRVRLERNEKNLGIPRTRNRGIDLARGEYLALLDSDDLSLPTRLAAQVAFLDAHPDVAAVGAWARAMRADGRPERRVHRCPESHRGLAFSLCFRCAPRQSTMMIRRELLAAARYDEQCEVSQDLELFGRLARDHEIRALPVPLVLFRHHPDRVTEQAHPEREGIRRRIFETRLREAGLDPSSEDLDRHLRLTGRTSGRSESLDPGFVAWAGAWLEDLAERFSNGAGRERAGELHPEVRAAASDLWRKLLRRARDTGMRDLPLGAAPRLTRDLGPGGWWLRARQIGKRRAT